MLEIWFAKAKSTVQSSSAGPLRRLNVLSPGVWIILAVLVFMGGRLLWLQAERSAHSKEITDAFGSVSLFYGTPQMNHAGSRLTYVATCDQGFALFLCDTATGRKQIVTEQNRLGDFGDTLDLRAWPWSPDDSAFIYTAQNKLFVSPVNEASAAKPVVMDIPQVSDVVWLTPDEFVYCSNGRPGDARKQADGKWLTRSLSDQGGASSLTVISTNSIAWLSGNSICQLDLNKPLTSTNSSLVVPAPVVPVKPPTNGLALWLDASTLSLADQTPVTALVDLSQEKNDAIPNQNPPIYNAPTNSRALRGKGTIHFTSADSITNATGLKSGRNLGLTNTMPRTVFAVLRRDAACQLMAVNIGEAGGHGTYFGVYDQANALYLPGGWDYLDNTVGPSSGNWNVLEVVYDGTSQEGYVNGALKRATTFQLNTADKAVEIGLRTGKNAAGSDGDFAELLIYNRALAADERRQVEDYLSGKWFGGKFKPAPSSPEWFDPQLVVPAPVVPVKPLTNGLELWLDASTLSLADQTPVTALGDLSPKKNDALPNQNPPLYNAPTNSRALRGKGTIHFTSANSLPNATGLKTGRYLGLTNTMPRTVFAVLRRDEGRQMMINIGETGGHGTYFGLCDQGNALYLPGGWDWLDNTVEPSSANWNILEVVYDGTSQKGYVNGALKRAATFQLNTADREVEIGLRTGKNTEGSDGDFAELLIYNRALSVGERRRVEDYLSGKWFGGKFQPAPGSLEWFEPEMDGLVGLSWSKVSGQFLLRRTVKEHDSLWSFNPDADGTNQMVALVQSNSLQNVQWAGDGKIVGLSREPGHRGVVLTDAAGTEKKRWLKHADIRSFTVTPDGRELLILGIITNEPSVGIWLCDLDSGQVRPLVDCSDHPSSLARSIRPFNGFIKLPSGRTVYCALYPPAHFDRDKKYPLVIGNTMFGVAINGDHGRLWVPAVATRGAFVVIVNRWSWWGGIEQWEENVRGVYQSLVQDPCIDARQVYLFGASAETQYLSECLERNPSLWRGGIFLNPSRLPDFSKSPPFQSRPKIFISTGGEEQQDARLKKYQADALNAGNLVDFIIHPGEKHHLVGNTAQFERTKAMIHFIFEE